VTFLLIATRCSCAVYRTKTGRYLKPEANGVGVRYGNVVGMLTCKKVSMELMNTPAHHRGV
jgi:hypothetical protein